MLEFQINKEQKKELQQRYDDLEVVVKRIKKILKELNGFSLIIDPYVKIYNVIAPHAPIMTIFGRFNIRKFFNTILIVIAAAFFLFIGMPIISGIMKISWSEMVPIILTIIGMSLLATVKQKLGVLPGG